MKNLTEYINESLRDRMKNNPNKKEIMRDIAENYIRSIKIKDLKLKDYPMGWNVTFETFSNRDPHHLIIEISEELIDKKQALKIYDDMLKVFDKEIICLDQFDFKETERYGDKWFKLEFELL